MKANSSLEVSDGAINAFWQWFSNHHSDIEARLDRSDTDDLTGQINAQVNALSPQLAWEIGPGLVAPYMLVFPAEGDAARKAVVEKIMEAAPRLEGWEFHTSRPTRTFQPEVQLPGRGLSFRTTGWHFELKPSATSDRLELRIFDDELARVDEKTALTVVFILLDAVLGEDIVERWIGNIRVLSGSSRGDILPMPAIADRLARLIPR
jgi:hypothetical protein